MAELDIGFLIDRPGWPLAVFETTHTYDGGRLRFDGQLVLGARDRSALERGVSGTLPGGGHVFLELRRGPGGTPDLVLSVDGAPTQRDDLIRAQPTSSAWMHACQALAASAAGFVASYLYVLRAASEQSDWALKMANHMAGWHLLLTFTLFPASVWGQRLGIRAVQFVSLVFFLIHVGIALANLGGDASTGHTGMIALFNALSGALFLVAAIYGNRAHRDMDPLTNWRLGRAKSQPSTGH